MNTNFTRATFFFLMICATGFGVQAQTIQVSGVVTDASTKQPLPGVNVSIKGRAAGTSTAQDGTFHLRSTTKESFTIVFSYVGYTSVEREVSGSTMNMQVGLEETTILGQEVVISASRTPERILESPVTIERISAASIKDLPSASFYDALANLKGVEMSAQSLTFKSVNTRGFNSNGNIRLNQFVDG
ncbi:MAG: TonB-dependent receptor, partial [Pedobacter sp.]|nr:TonB-dependent receptor [Pedobacter sp.]